MIRENVQPDMTFKEENGRIKIFPIPTEGNIPVSHMRKLHTTTWKCDHIFMEITRVHSYIPDKVDLMLQSKSIEIEFKVQMQKDLFWKDLQIVMNEMWTKGMELQELLNGIEI